MWRLAAFASGGAFGVAFGVGSMLSGISAQENEETVRQTINHQQQHNRITIDWSKARDRARVLANRVKEGSGSPGLLMAVGVDGKIVCSEGLGFADIENGVRCDRETRMRVASISKPVTMLAVARLWEEGKLDLDAPIQRYSTFPEKTFDGEPVSITTRQLVSHVAGIRHYKANGDKEDKKEKRKDAVQANTKKSNLKKGIPKDAQQSSLTYSAGEYGRAEYFIKDQFDSVEQSLKLFANDDLLHRPGSKYLYSTHGWTLVSAVVEGAAKEDFLTYLTKMLSGLGLRYITPEYQQSLIYGRAR